MERALAQATAVADRAGVEVTDLTDLADMTAASQLFDELWGTGPGDSYLSPSLMRALTHAGNYGAGARRPNGVLVGAVLGFLGQDADGPYLHSHILGVSPQHSGSGVGSALKQHQRAWALSHDLRKVTWTFDPLVRRNAYFNLSKLGADAAAYLENFYGEMDDDVNGSDESDRLLIAWLVESPQVERVGEGAPEPELNGEATVALTMDGQVRTDPWGPTILCGTPDDIVTLRRDDPEGAMIWRRALRNTLGSAMQKGYEVTGFTRSGWYVLERA